MGGTSAWSLTQAPHTDIRGVAICWRHLQLERFIDGRWQEVAPSDRLKITQLDAQVRHNAHDNLFNLNAHVSTC